MRGDISSWLVLTGVVSVAVCVCLAAAVPFFVSRIPEDYFLRERGRRSRWLDRRPLLHAVLRAGRNGLGLLLLIAGVAMLFVPGQGILTIIAGLTLLEFPGKGRLERGLVRRPAVSRSMNWMRKRRGVPPLKMP